MFAIEHEEDGKTEMFSTPHETWNYIYLLKGQYYLNITVYIDTDETPDTSGESTHYGPYLNLMKIGDVAALILYDSACSEYWAMDNSFPDGVDVNIRKQLSNGEPTPLASDLCVSVDTAFQAAKEFILSGLRPNWLRYKYVG